MKSQPDQWVNDLRSVMKTKAGRAVLWRIMDNAGVFRATFDPNPHVSAMREGARQIGLTLFSEIEANCFDEFIAARAEFITQRSAKDARPNPAAE